MNKKAEAVKNNTVCFVCTGNTCRSPMAEALYNHLYAKQGRRAVSRGLQAYGDPISDNAIIALSERGIDTSPYIARPSVTVDAKTLAECELTVGITSRHADSLIFAFPEHASKITALPVNIPDPWGGDLDGYRRTLEMIEKALVAVFRFEGDGNAEH